LNDDGTEHEELTKVRLPGHNNLWRSNIWYCVLTFYLAIFT
jgi:hypothetical protein